MSEWITYRPPTEDDADYEKCVWTMCAGKAVLWGYAQICEGQPWMPTNRPEPYVKPKRFEVRWSSNKQGKGTWVVISYPTGKYAGRIVSRLHHLTQYNDKNRKAAYKIAKILEEETP